MISAIMVRVLMDVHSMIGIIVADIIKIEEAIDWIRKYFIMDSWESLLL